MKLSSLWELLRLCKSPCVWQLPEFMAVHVDNDELLDVRSAGTLWGVPIEDSPDGEVRLLSRAEVMGREWNKTN